MKISRSRTIALVVSSFLEILLFGGLQYGWFSLLFILKQENVFQHLCAEGSVPTPGNGSRHTSGEVCNQQDERFNLLFSIGGAAFTVLCVFTGQFYYRLAIKAVRTASMAVLVTGVLLFGFTTSDSPWLVLPGIVAVGVGGLALLISNMHVALLLPRGSSLYVGLINGCFDSSVLTQMVIKALYENGVSLMSSCTGVAILCVVISGTCTLLHPGSIEHDVTTSLDDVSIDVTDVKTTEGFVNESFTRDEKAIEVQRSADTIINKGKASLAQDVVSTTSGDDAISVWGILRSPIFICHVIWMSAVLLRFFYFIGSINRVLVMTLDSDEMVSYFTDIMTYTMLGGLLSSFIAGQVLEAQSRWFTGPMRAVIPLGVTSLLAVLLSSLAFLSPAVVLYADFIVLTFLRSFLFSVNMDFVITSFPRKFMSLLYGVVISVSGILTLAQYALFTWTKRYDGAIFHVNTFLLCVSIISLGHPFLIWVTNRQTSRDSSTHNNGTANKENDGTAANNKNGHITKL